LFGLLFNSAVYCNSDSTKSTSKTVIYDSSSVKVREPDNVKQRELLADPDYKYNRKEPAPATLWQRFKEWLSRKISELLSTKGGEVGLTILQYALVVAVIVLIVFLLLKNNIRSIFYGKSANIAIDFKEFDEDIHSINFNELINMALSQKDFRRAVRLHFLKLLKELTDRNLISWKTDKTNNDYFIELSNTSYSAHFKELALLYEYIWYGDFQLKEEEFKVTIERFNAFVI
jgi:hypothetical protein